MLLMCKNAVVFNTESCEVFEHNLMPGQLSSEPTMEIFKMWSQSRYSSRENYIARRIQGGLFGQGNRQVINRVTRSLSLSDCYWLKEEEDSSTFEGISPYFNDFWTGAGTYQRQAVPTLYVDGMLPKYWESVEWLVKESTPLEVACYELCRDLNIPVAEVRNHSGGKIAVRNFTSPDIMFEAADTSGRIDAVDFTLHDVINVFGASGTIMIVVDAIVGNVDRHSGNFGFVRCANTGKYLDMAPLFDFDHALSSSEVDFSLITQAAVVVKNRGE